jgi:hypothetical protein
MCLDVGIQIDDRKDVDCWIADFLVVKLTIVEMQDCRHSFIVLTPLGFMKVRLGKARKG